MIIVNIVVFIFSIAISLYIPGRVVGFILGLKSKGIEEKVVSLLLGVSLFLLTSYILAWIGTPLLHYAVIFIFLAVFIKKRKKILDTSFKGIDTLSIAIITIGTLFATAKTATSGILTAQGWIYNGINAADGLVHVARIKNFLIHFPPQHPAVAGVEFRGYHYFYDFLLSRFSLLFGFSAEDLYFRFFTFLVALLFGVSVFVFIKKMTSSKLTTQLGTFIAYFGLSFGVFFWLILDYNAMTIEPINLIYDPSIYLSLSIFLVALSFITRITTYRKAIFISILLGVLAQIKVYVGLIGVLALITITGYKILTTRKLNKYYIVANALTALLTIVTFFPNNYGVGTLVFAPLLFYKQYIQQDFFSEWNWELKRQIFAAHSNYLRIAILYFQAVSIFWILILGPRIIILTQFKKTFTKKFWKNELNIVLVFVFATLVILPSLFVQSIAVFDIGQFFWILMPLLSIPMAFTLKNMRERYYKIGTVMIILICAYYAVIHIFYSVKPMFQKPNYIVSSHDAAVVRNAAEITDPDETIIVLTPVIDETIQKLRPSLISALSGRQTYYEEEIIHSPLGEEYEIRHRNLADLFYAFDKCDSDKIIEIANRVDSSVIVSAINFNCNFENAIQKILSGDQLHLYSIDK